jgi:hypothetical protein
VGGGGGGGGAGDTMIGAAGGFAQAHSIGSRASGINIVASRVCQDAYKAIDFLPSACACVPEHGPMLDWQMSAALFVQQQQRVIRTIRRSNETQEPARIFVAIFLFNS